MKIDENITGREGGVNTPANIIKLETSDSANMKVYQECNLEKQRISDIFRDSNFYTPENIVTLEKAFGLSDISKIDGNSHQSYFIILKGNSHEYKQSSIFQLIARNYFNNSGKHVRHYLSARKQGVSHIEAVQIAEKKIATNPRKLLKDPDFYTPENIGALENAFGLTDIVEIKVNFDEKKIFINGQIYFYSQGSLLHLIGMKFLKKSVGAARHYLAHRKNAAVHEVAIQEAHRIVASEKKKNPGVLFRDPNFYSPSNIATLEKAFGLQCIKDLQNMNFDKKEFIIGDNHYLSSQAYLLSVIAKNFFSDSNVAARCYLYARKENLSHEQATKYAKKEVESDPVLYLKNEKTYTRETILVLEKAFQLNEISEIRSSSKKVHLINLGSVSFHYSQKKIIQLIGSAFFGRKTKPVPIYLLKRKAEHTHEDAMKEAISYAESITPNQVFSRIQIYTPEVIKIIENAFGIEIEKISSTNTRICSIKISEQFFEYTQAALFGMLFFHFFKDCKHPQKTIRVFLLLCKKGIDSRQALELSKLPWVFGWLEERIPLNGIQSINQCFEFADKEILRLKSLGNPGSSASNSQMVTDHDRDLFFREENENNIVLQEIHRFLEQKDSKSASGQAGDL